MGFIRRGFEFLSHPSNSRTMGLVVVLLLVTAVSLTVYVAQQQQNLRQRAEEPALCSEVTTFCDNNVKFGDTCNNPGEKCRLVDPLDPVSGPDIIVECK